MEKENDFFYKASQGESRDREILGRYKTIIDYFIENPDRINGNRNPLSLLYFNDAVLMSDESLRDRLLKQVLNSGLKNHAQGRLKWSF